MNSLYGCYRTRKFSDIYENVENFKTDLDFFSNAGLNPGFIDSNIYKTAYYLLLARYANSHIASSDESQFKMKLFSIIFQYGPTWEKRLSVQNSLRNLTDDELMLGTKQINNHSYNPSTEPSTDTLEEFTTTNEQTSTKFKKSKIDAYERIMDVLKVDVSETFLGEFKRLFITIVQPELPLWYTTEISEEEV